MSVIELLLKKGKLPVILVVLSTTKLTYEETTVTVTPYYVHCKLGFIV
jgi:hypothetical protein